MALERKIDRERDLVSPLDESHRELDRREWGVKACHLENYATFLRASSSLYLTLLANPIPLSPKTILALCLAFEKIEKYSWIIST